MGAMQQKFEIFNLPQNPNDAKNLSALVTNQFGAKGWEIVSVVQLGATLLLVMQKPLMPPP